jgi:hypothetical protein
MVTVLEVDIAIAKLKKYKSPGSDKILAELIQAEGKMLLSEIHKLINSVLNKEELPDQWKESIIVVPVHKRCDETDCNNCRGISLINIIQNVMEYPSLRVKSINIDGIISMGFEVTDQLLIRFSAFDRYWRKNGSTKRQYISCS